MSSPQPSPGSEDRVTKLSDIPNLLALESLSLTLASLPCSKAVSETVLSNSPSAGGSSQSLGPPPACLALTGHFCWFPQPGLCQRPHSPFPRSTLETIKCPLIVALCLCACGSCPGRGWAMGPVKLHLWLLLDACLAHTHLGGPP